MTARRAMRLPTEKAATVSGRRTSRHSRSVLGGKSLKLRRILVPLDFSGKSRQALNVAIPLAQWYGAKISLIHAVEHPVYPEAFGNLAVDVDTPGQAAQNRLAEMAASLLPAGLAGRTCVCYGSAYRNICATAEDLRADLIIITTHGRAGLSRALLGSTAERVVRHALCPVLTVRRRSEGSPLIGLTTSGDRLPWRRILVPLDFSLRSLRALDVAVRLAKDSGARLHLLHVVEPGPYVTGPDGAALAAPSPVAFERAKANLPRLARRLVPSTMTFTTTIARGEPVKVVVKTAKATGTDLIVLSTHGHTRLERFLMGSTAERVVRYATCPVFVVRQCRRKNLSQATFG